MTIKDTIDNLPWYQRGSVDQLINAWNRDNTLTRFLQGAGNKEELEALIEDFKYQDFTMFGAEPPLPRPGTEAPDEEEPTPDEEPSAGGDSAG